MKKVLVLLSALALTFTLATAEGKCSGDKKPETKCESGKCSGDKKSDAKCSGDKKPEGKCGKGKCGGDK